MYLDPSSELAEVRAVAVRNFLKRWQHREWPVEALAEDLELTSHKAAVLLSALVARGLVARVEGTEEFYSNTIAGNQFANASAARSITRATAERKVKEFLERVDEVNSNPYYLYQVNRVRVFGSYLTDAERLNDVDLVVEIVPKESERTRAHELDMQRVSEARQDGRHFSNIVDELFWPQNQVLLFLKARSRVYSFHSPTDAILKSTVVQTLFVSDSA